MVTTIAIDNEYCEALVRRGACGDALACHALIEYLWPIWLDMVRSSRGMQSLPNAEDGIHDVIARLVEKLGQPEGRGLVLYGSWRERNTDKFFEDWLRIVTTNAIRDYLREKRGMPRGATADPGVNRLLNEFAAAPIVEELGIRPPITQAQTARELLEFASGRLEALQLVVLGSWLKGATFEEIATEEQLDAEVARQLLRSAVAILRRYFAGSRDQ